MYAYWTIFASAFIAATLLPAQSELVLGGFIAAGDRPVWLLVTVATLGNTLGSCVNWVLGRFFSRFMERGWFPIGPEALSKGEAWYRKYGRWSLLLSWAPVIGDPITLVAGILREPFWSFILIVAFAKLARYLVVAGLALGWAL